MSLVTKTDANLHRQVMATEGNDEDIELWSPNNKYAKKVALKYKDLKLNVENA